MAAFTARAHHRVLLGMTVACLMLTGCSHNPSAQPTVSVAGWTTVVLPGFHVEAKFPGQPKVRSGRRTLDGHAFTVAAASIKTAGSVSYGLEAIRLSASVQPNNVAPTLSSGIGGVAGPLEADVSNNHATTFDGFVAQSADLSRNGKTIHVVNFLVTSDETVLIIGPAGPAFEAFAGTVTARK